MNRKIHTKLANTLNRATTAKEFFIYIWDCIMEGSTSGPGYKIKFIKDDPIIVCFSLMINLDDKAAKHILETGLSKGFFNTVREIRFVYTNVTKKQARLFKSINSDISVYWITLDDYIEYTQDPNSFLKKSNLNDPLFFTCNMREAGFKPI